VGAVRPEAVVLNGQIAAGTVMRVTLSVDRRAIDGALAAKWLSVFLSVIERPLQILS
jgi:pyruvate dehydrogenase E2 component (dihydrolipoamide acetyltransferase)